MIDFLKYRVVYAIFSLAIFATFVGDFVYNRMTTGHAFSYSVEFTGGTQVLLGFDKSVKSSQIVTILDKHGWPGALTREFGQQEILIRVKDYDADVVGLGERIRSTIEKELEGNTVKVLQIDSIGQGVGQALAWNSIKALVIGLILMLAYIAWRFWSIGYAVGAVVALFHDAIAMLLFFLLFDKEVSINLIGAILAILGYSINDTIVIFTQIQQNIKKMTKKPINDIVNISINQTLRRTLLTSISTALIVISLIIFGGEALRDFASALLVGIIFGTYSSIYIASPIMLLFYKKAE